MSRQLAFDLPVRAALGRCDFFVSPANAAALAMIDQPHLWPNGKLVLVGPEGAGKSHLAEVFAHDRNAIILGADTLSAMPDPPEAVVIEDADRIAGQPEAEELLFHLHNALAARGGLLLLTARHPAAQWGVRLPDLSSRLESAARATLLPPDDALLGAVLVKLFADRQIHVPPALISWLVPRIERSFSAARSLVAALDAQALAEGRPVSRAMATALLDSAAAKAP